MTEPADNSPVGEATDIDVAPDEVDAVADASDTPATTDPEQLTDDGALGGAGGPGGAG
jgi:hypothetical protein